ncbi:hypothetical protein J6590_035117 [Homalodisca vitripennis]|nr:hypothetical protein J6590_035117 [Homalodisca vitripennis]
MPVNSQHGHASCNIIVIRPTDSEEARVLSDKNAADSAKNKDSDKRVPRGSPNQETCPLTAPHFPLTWRCRHIVNHLILSIRRRNDISSFRLSTSDLLFGETPLHLACANCHADEVRHLLSFVKSHHGPEMSSQFVNSVNEDGATALHYAGQITKTEIALRDNPTEDKEVVRLLLEAQADVNIQTHKVRQSIAMCGHKELDVICSLRFIS